MIGFKKEVNSPFPENNLPFMTTRMNTKPEFEAIVHELLSPDLTQSIPKDLVLSCMASMDLETMGAVFKLIHEPEHYERVQPPLSFDDYRGFHLKYYECCLCEDLDGEWSASRYMAAHSLVNWFTGLWDDQSIPRDALLELKTLLARLYKDGDQSLRVAIETGVLEHLLVNRDILSFFSDWKEDAELKVAYSEAQSMAAQIRESLNGSDS